MEFAEVKEITGACKRYRTLKLQEKITLLGCSSFIFLPGNIVVSFHFPNFLLLYPLAFTFAVVEVIYVAHIPIVIAVVNTTNLFCKVY